MGRQAGRVVWGLRCKTGVQLKHGTRAVVAMLAASHQAGLARTSFMARSNLAGQLSLTKAPDPLLSFLHTRTPLGLAIHKPTCYCEPVHACPPLHRLAAVRRPGRHPGRLHRHLCVVDAVLHGASQGGRQLVLGRRERGCQWGLAGLRECTCLHACHVSMYGCWPSRSMCRGGRHGVKWLAWGAARLGGRGSELAETHRLALGGSTATTLWQQQWSQGRSR